MSYSHQDIYRVSTIDTELIRQMLNSMPKEFGRRIKLLVLHICWYLCTFHLLYDLKLNFFLDIHQFFQMKIILLFVNLTHTHNYFIYGKDAKLLVDITICTWVFLYFSEKNIYSIIWNIFFVFYRPCFIAHVLWYQQLFYIHELCFSHISL